MVLDSHPANSAANTWPISWTPIVLIKTRLVMTRIKTRYLMNRTMWASVLNNGFCLKLVEKCLLSLMKKYENTRKSSWEAVINPIGSRKPRIVNSKRSKVILRRRRRPKLPAAERTWRPKFVAFRLAIRQLRWYYPSLSCCLRAYWFLSGGKNGKKRALPRHVGLGAKNIVAGSGGAKSEGYTVTPSLRLMPSHYADILDWQPRLNEL